MTARRTHYDNLKVTHDAPQEVIHAAYRALALKYHPDRNSHPDAARIMRIINAAIEVLGNPERRRKYDRQIAATAEARPEHSKGTPESSRQRRPTRNKEEWERFAMLQKMMKTKGIECIHCHRWSGEFRSFTDASQIPFFECPFCSHVFTAVEYDNYTVRASRRHDYYNGSGRHCFLDRRCAMCGAIDSGPEAWAATCPLNPDRTSGVSTSA